MRTMTCLIGVAVCWRSALVSLPTVWLDAGRVTNISDSSDAPSFAPSRHCLALDLDICFPPIVIVNGSTFCGQTAGTISDCRCGFITLPLKMDEVLTGVPRHIRRDL